MYQKKSNQLSFEKFYLPFGGKLNPTNRWVLLSAIIPWPEFEDDYALNFSGNKRGCPAKSVRMALGALIIKERLKLSDEEAVELIRENPYLQFFLGLSEFSDKAPFDASMYVHFRKRFSIENLNKINERIVKATIDRVSKKDDISNSNGDNDGDNSSKENVKKDISKSTQPSVCNAGKNDVTHKGKMIIDATCTPADIHFATDINVLNSARKKSEEIIDVLYPLSNLKKKPRTYKKRARKDFLKISMSKRVSAAERRKAIRRQLGYLSRNLKHISRLSKTVSLSYLNKRQYKNLLVLNLVLQQQNEMYKTRSHSVKNRIVSVSQPHVRPIVRGKLGAKTEFGAKISTSLVDGFCFLDRISWEAYNETVDLKSQLELFHERFGVYPESVLADKIYRTRKNRDLCESLGVNLSAMPLGRPTKDKELRKEQLKKCRKDDVARIPIEGKYGEGKRKYSLNRIMSKLAQTSEATIGIIFVVMNLEKYLRDAFFAFIFLCEFIFKWIKHALVRITASFKQRINTVHSYLSLRSLARHIESSII